MNSTLSTNSTASNTSNASTGTDTCKRRLRRKIHRVLWVDDDPLLTATITRRMRRESFEILSAADGMQGYWSALTMKPELVVTDLCMPRWEGRDLLECLSQNRATASIPVVVVTGRADRYDRAELEQFGVTVILEKPVEWSLLVSVFRRQVYDLVPKRD